MAELTLEQKRALAIAKAKQKAAAAQVETVTAPSFEENLLAKAKDISNATRNQSVLDDLGKIAKNVDTTVRGAADTMSFGFADELAAGADTALGIGNGFEKNLAQQRARDAADAAERPGSRLLGQLAGGVTQGAGLVKAGLSPTATAITAGKPLLTVAGTGAVEGGALGALQGLGSGTDTEDRINKASTGLLFGAALGGGIPLATEVVRKAATPVAAYLNPQNAKDKILAALMRRADTTPEEIAASLQAAQDDGQSMFMAADALDNPGQRMMSTASRTPSDARKSIVDALSDRQSDQGKRLSEYLAEGFNAPDTAAKRKLALEAERAMLADVNYPNASATATAVDVTGAVNQIDDVLKPGVNKIVEPGSGLTDDSTDALLSRFKARMTNGRELLTDFDEVLKLKSEIGDMAEDLGRKGQKYKSSQLRAVANRLDAALEKASPDYRAANDAFRAQSKTIDAIEKGTDATSRRARFSDTVSDFEAMKPGEQMAFRSGYSDPLIASVEGNASAPTTNKARALLSPKMEEEFDAFAIPGRKDKMLRRIDREQQMFETANAALGGSKSADNIADMADSAIDPGVLAALARGSIKDAALTAITKAANSARGLPPSVIEKLVPALMETNPAYARQIFSQGQQVQQLSDSTRAKIIAALMNSTTAVPARVSP